MTRRKFIRKLIKAGSAVWILDTGYSILVEHQASSIERLHRFTRAIRLEKYPGSQKSLRDISKASKWSG